MRTTLSIDDHIMAELKKTASLSGLPLKKVVNMTLEIGLSSLRQKEDTPYRSKTYAMGHPVKINFDKALQMASALEDDNILEKIEMGK